MGRDVTKWHYSNLGRKITILFGSSLGDGRFTAQRRVGHRIESVASADVDRVLGKMADTGHGATHSGHVAEERLQPGQMVSIGHVLGRYAFGKGRIRLIERRIRWKFIAAIVDDSRFIRIGR